MSTALRGPVEQSETGQQRLHSRRRNSRLLTTLLGITGLLAVLFVAIQEHTFWGGRFYFDDAFMYVRYAYNFRHGWGIAWNPAGPHTYGLTSLPWFFVILAGSLLTHDASKLLTLSSCLTGLGAMAAIAVLISTYAHSAWLRRSWLLLPWIALPMLLNQRFAEVWSNGMETMLGMLALTLFLMAHKRFQEQEGRLSTLLLAACALLCALTRPELLLVVCILPAVSWVLLKRKASRKQLLTYFALLAGLLLIALAACYRYFHTAVPLAFYLKAQRGYAGYSLVINPWTYTSVFLAVSMPATLLIAGLTRQRHARMLAVFLVPLLAEILYLATVTQIMGEQARYYIPLLPLLVVPAGVLVDDAICNGTPLITPLRALAVGLVLLLSRDVTRPFTLWLGDRMAAHTVFYERPAFLPRAVHDLPPVDAWAASAAFASKLPAGTTMASTEVGMLGAYAPQINIVDLAGLNDFYLARHSSDVEYILSTKPDAMWLPNTDYTKLYGSLVSFPGFLRDYDLYQQFLGAGLAVRKTSRNKPDFERAIQEGWQAVYPGIPMNDYRVTDVHWNAGALVHGNRSNVLESFQRN